MWLVRTGTEDGRAYHWWAKFLAYGMDLGDLDIQTALDNHNSRATINPSYYYIGDAITFETEQDFTMFVLKWA